MSELKKWVKEAGNGIIVMSIENGKVSECLANRSGNFSDHQPIMDRIRMYMKVGVR